MSTVKFKNLNTEETIEVDDGWSWTTFLFGIFVPLFREDYSTFVFGLAMWTIIIVGGSGLGIIIAAIPFRLLAALIYNEWYIAKLKNEDHLRRKSLSAEERFRMRTNRIRNRVE